MGRAGAWAFAYSPNGELAATYGRRDGDEMFSDIALEGSATLQMTGWAERRSGVARL